MRLNKDDYMILPDSELREQLRKDKNKLRWLSFPIVGYIVLLVIFLPELTSINASMGLVGYSTAAAIVCYTFIFADTPGKQKKLVIALDLIQFGLIILGFINAVSGGSYSTVFFQFLLAGGANGANLIARPIIKEMSDLTSVKDKKEIGDVITLTLARKDGNVDVDVTLGKPADNNENKDQNNSSDENRGN